MVEVEEVLAWIIAVISFPWSWLALRYIPFSEVNLEELVLVGVYINILIILTVLRLGGII